MSYKFEFIEAVAAICHEANRAYCASLGDFSQLPWRQAPIWQRGSCVDGVRFRLENPDVPPSASHDNWAREKVRTGWKYGPVKDAELKTHPCLVPFEKLPPEQQFKDVLFGLIVQAAVTGAK